MQSARWAERDFRGAGERVLGESDLFQQSLIGERGEAAQQDSGGGIDGLNGHGLAQRQAYQERRARGEERPLRAIAQSMPDLRIELSLRLLFVVCSSFVLSPPLPPSLRGFV